MSTANILLIVLGILTLAFVVVFVQDLIKHKDEILSDKNVTKNAIISSIIGFIVNFFDTLGIGSFAPATALLRAAKQTEDRVIPGCIGSISIYTKSRSRAYYLGRYAYSCCSRCIPWCRYSV